MWGYCADSGDTNRGRLGRCVTATQLQAPQTPLLPWPEAWPCVSQALRHPGGGKHGLGSAAGNAELVSGCMYVSQVPSFFQNMLTKKSNCLRYKV